MALVCPRCDYSTSHKQNFIKHLNRKVVCTPTKNAISLDEMKSLYITEYRNIVCKKCSKTFKHESSLSRHRNTCSPILQASNSTDILTILENQSKMLQEIQKIQSNQVFIATTPPQNTNQNITQNVTNNVTYNITSFGSDGI